LVPMAEEVTKLKAVCMLCQGDASFSKRSSLDFARVLSLTAIAFLNLSFSLGDELEVELIGGADKYIAVCRRCYHEPNFAPHLSKKVAMTQFVLADSMGLNEVRGNF